MCLGCEGSVHHCSVVLLRGLLAIIASLFVAHFFETLRICGADKRRLHVVNAALWVHQVLVIFPLDLDHPHHYSVDHVDRLAFIIVTFGIFLILLSSLDVLVHIVLDTLAILIVNAIICNGLLAISGPIDHVILP